jgi:hypothetical protein
MEQDAGGWNEMVSESVEIILGAISDTGHNAAEWLDLVKPTIETYQIKEHYDAFRGPSVGTSPSELLPALWPGRPSRKAPCGPQNRQVTADY